MKVSVIVPCRNELRYIDAFLANLLAQQTGGFEWDAWMADGMSDDGTRERVLARDPRIHPIDNPKLSAASGLNAALAQSSGEIVVRMDVHTIYAEDYLRQCVTTLKRTGADNVGGPWIARGDSYVPRAIAAAFQSRFSAGGAKSHDPSYEGEVDSVYLGCWHRATFERIGPFDERFGRNQDDEWNLRLIRAGGRVWQSPHIRSWYSVRPSLSALAKQYFDYGFWKVAVIRKHGKPASWRHLAPVLFLLLNVVLAVVMPRLLLFVDLPYLLLTLASSFSVAARAGWELLPILPVVFAIYHFAYGTGFLWGLMRTRV